MVTETHHHVCDLFRSWGQRVARANIDWDYLATGSLSLSLKSPTLKRSHTNKAQQQQHSLLSAIACNRYKVKSVCRSNWEGGFFSLFPSYYIWKLALPFFFFWLFLFLAGDYRIFTILLYDIPFTGFFVLVFFRFQIFVAAALLWPCLNM